MSHDAAAKRAGEDRAVSRKTSHESIAAEHRALAELHQEAHDASPLWLPLALEDEGVAELVGASAGRWDRVLTIHPHFGPCYDIRATDLDGSEVTVAREVQKHNVPIITAAPRMLEALSRIAAIAGGRPEFEAIQRLAEDAIAEAVERKDPQ